MKLESHAHIYVAIAPLQLLAISSIVSEKQISDNETHICFVFYRNEIEFTLSNCIKLHYKANGIFDILKNIRDFRSKMRLIQCRYGKISVYIPHPYHLPTNYLLFGIRERSAYLIPDGLLNYYYKTVNFKQFITMLAKTVLALILGIRYHPYTGHLTAYDRNIYNGVFTFNPDRLVTIAGKIRMIPKKLLPASDKPSKNQKTCIFLDHDIERFFRGPISLGLRRAQKQYLKSAEYRTIFYKKHPTQILNGKIIDDLGVPVKLIQSKLPVEMLIQEYNPTEVVSFLSSALITIRDVFPHIRCTAIVTKFALSPAEKILRELFVQRKISLIIA